MINIKINNDNKGTILTLSMETGRRKRRSNGHFQSSCVSSNEATHVQALIDFFCLSFFFWIE